MLLIYHLPPANARIEVREEPLSQQAIFDQYIFFLAQYICDFLLLRSNTS